MANPQIRTAGSVREAVAEFFTQERRNGERIQKNAMGLAEDDELPPYIFQDYPKALYSIDPNEPPITVKTAGEEKKLGGAYLPYAEAKASWDEPIALEYDPEGELVDVGEPAPKPKRKR